MKKGDRVELVMVDAWDLSHGLTIGDVGEVVLCNNVTGVIYAVFDKLSPLTSCVCLNQVQLVSKEDKKKTDTTGTRCRFCTNKSHQGLGISYEQAWVCYPCLTTALDLLSTAFLVKKPSTMLQPEEIKS